MTDKLDILKARLLVAEHDKEKKARKAAQKNKENEETTARGGKKKQAATQKKRSAPTVQWAKRANWSLTDELLTIIEGKPRYRQAFGFDKGQSGPVDTGGKKLQTLYIEVAEELFITSKDDTTYSAEDLPALGGVIKNRVGALKSKYQVHHTSLGSTGHGLVAAGKEKEIIQGSDIANAWDAIKKNFPWYKRMDALMGTSPIVNRSAVAHSGTRVDLSVLDRDGEAHDGPITVDSDDDAGSAISGWGPSSPSPTRDDEDESKPADTPVPATPAVKAEATPVSSARGTKRKSMHDHIQELTAQDRSHRLKAIEVKEHEKTVRAQAKYEAKSALEIARLEHQQREAQRQHEHELLMMERRMQFEAMRHGPPAPAVPARGMYGLEAPAYGAPPPDDVLDPSLRA
ncbi:hypothetical protein B0H11DRAFT_2214912 [Mycena galericulata]|nr:hypothetical protein B0H11DRAFT_2214912 [Mycena galericulata]